MKKKILILNGQYLPGYKGGGPIQSCVNMIENLYEEFDFYVLCADRDFKEEKPYSNIKVNAWNTVGHANVYYMTPNKQNLKGFEEILNSIDYDTLYLNGFFSPIFTIKPLILRRLGKLRNNKIIITPRGDFTGGCENKKIKKYGYIYFSKIIGLYKKLKWQATSEIEKQDILKKFPEADVFTVPNLPAKFISKEPIISKEIGELRLVFISRIFPKKNLKYALEVLTQINKGNIIFDIYGPMEDKNYWSECKEIIKTMPENVKIEYRGEVQHSEIPHTFEQYHAFFFPTLGENYGHVIVEAMMNNCLCILSKGTTPWNEYIDKLDLGAKLDNRKDFINIIQTLLDIDNTKFRELLIENNEFISKFNNVDDLNKNYKNKIFAIY